MDMCVSELGEGGWEGLRETGGNLLDFEGGKRVQEGGSRVGRVAHTSEGGKEFVLGVMGIIFIDPPGLPSSRLSSSQARVAFATPHLRYFLFQTILFCSLFWSRSLSLLLALLIAPVSRGKNAWELVRFRIARERRARASCPLLHIYLQRRNVWASINALSLDFRLTPSCQSMICFNILGRTKRIGRFWRGIEVLISWRRDTKWQGFLTCQAMGEFIIFGMKFN